MLSSGSVRGLKVTKEASSLANSLLLDDKGHASAHSKNSKRERITRAPIDGIRLKADLDRVDESTSNHFNSLKQPEKQPI